MFKNKYIIILLFLFFTLYFFIAKKSIIQEITQEWEDTTGGSIKLDDNGNFEGDYYLSITFYDNGDSHIHLTENCNGSDLCYIVKKNGEHSNIYIINQNMSKNEIVNEMIQNYTYFREGGFCNFCGFASYGCICA